MKTPSHVTIFQTNLLPLTAIAVQLTLPGRRPMMRPGNADGACSLLSHIDELGVLPLFGHMIDGNQNGRTGIREQLGC
ncbi:MAG: hypothetical protein R3C09_21235 [Pirellulaceae bacterium]